MLHMYVCMYDLRIDTDRRKKFSFQSYLNDRVNDFKAFHEGVSFKSYFTSSQRHAIYTEFSD